MLFAALWILFDKKKAFNENQEPAYSYTHKNNMCSAVWLLPALYQAAFGTGAVFKDSASAKLRVALNVTVLITLMTLKCSFAL